MSVAAWGDGDHFELPADAVELLRQVRPADRQGFIEEITQALAAAAETKDFRPLQDVLEAWTAAVRLQRQPGYEAMIERMQRRAWPARGPRRATSPSRLAVCAGGSRKPTRSGNKSSTTPTTSGDPGRRLPGAAALWATSPSVLPAGDPPVPRSARRGRLRADAADSRGRLSGARRHHRGASSRHHPQPVAARQPNETPPRRRVTHRWALLGQPRVA